LGRAYPSGRDRARRHRRFRPCHASGAQRGVDPDHFWRSSVPGFRLLPRPREGMRAGGPRLPAGTQRQRRIFSGGTGRRSRVLSALASARHIRRGHLSGSLSGGYTAAPAAYAVPGRVRQLHLRVPRWRETGYVSADEWHTCPGIWQGCARTLALHRWIPHQRSG